MSYYEGLSCPVCSKPFAPDEDIVVCPQCGLPHHRACWKSVGACFAAAKHNTAQQWSRNNAQADYDTATDGNVCPQCGSSNAQYAEFCSRCGHALTIDDWHSAPTQTPPPVWSYASYHSVGNDGGFDEPLDGVSASDLAAFMGTNQHYYLPRFQRMSRKESGGWNWSAFLFSPYWLFYRKQYLLGTLSFFVSLLSSILYSIVTIPVQTAETDAAMLSAMQDVQSHALFYPWLAISLISLTLSVIFGIKGNRFYYNHCRHKVLTIREKTPDLTATELQTYGGTSIGSALIFYFVSFFSVEIILAFLRSLSLI